MSNDTYLEDILRQEKLKDDSKELKELRKERNEVEELLKEEISSRLHIKYGGSKAKGTMNKSSYDLDVISYSLNENSDAGETLKEIFDNHEKSLSKKYFVERKKSALRVKRKDGKTDLCIDVVPGRYVDDDKEDCYLFQNEGDKQRLKTNLNKHISYIKDSGFVDEIRLAKIWKILRCISVKTFILELLIVKILGDKKAKEGFEENMKIFFENLYEKAETITIEDPANPQGNDLSDIFTIAARMELKNEAQIALERIAEDKWEDIFGKIEKTDDSAKCAAIIAAPASISNGAPLYGSEKF